MLILYLHFSEIITDLYFNKIKIILFKFIKKIIFIFLLILCVIDAVLLEEDADIIDFSVYRVTYCVLCLIMVYYQGLQSQVGNILLVYFNYNNNILAGIAQSVERRTENPCVTSSNLVPSNKLVFWRHRQVVRQ